MKKIEERDWYKKAEAQYNEMARAWNKLPGSKLLYPKDKFKITYCYHTKSERRAAMAWVEYLDGSRAKELITPLTCDKCGYPYPGAYDDVE